MLKFHFFQHVLIKHDFRAPLNLVCIFYISGSLVDMKDEGIMETCGKVLKYLQDRDKCVADSGGMVRR